MKKTSLAVLALLFAISLGSNAQTNTFPSSGYAGVGTTNPGYNSGSGSTTAHTLLDLYNSSNSSTTLLRISGTGEANGNYTGITLGAGGLQGRAKGALFYEPYGTSYGLGRLHFAVNGAPGEGEATLSDVRMTVLGNGNVGIGTTSPNQGLQVVSSNAAGSFGTFSSSSGQGLSVNPNSTVGVVNVFADYLGGAEPKLHLSTYSNRLTSGGIIVDASGSVAIGTADPKGYMLAVNGSAIATSVTVKVYGCWPDYVFKPAYRLPSLAILKDYIDKNRHLPEIPPAAEMAKNGIDLGDMNTKLLKKVEELTLYVIDLQKQMDRMKMQVAHKKTKIKKH